MAGRPEDGDLPAWHGDAVISKFILFAFQWHENLLVVEVENAPADVLSVCAFPLHPPGFFAQQGKYFRWLGLLPLQDYSERAVVQAAQLFYLMFLSKRILNLGIA